MRVGWVGGGGAAGDGASVGPPFDREPCDGEDPGEMSHA